MEQFRYAAFISYAHTDEAIAARLHKALETYKIPKNIDGYTPRARLPIFRDTAELTAHHNLSEKIREAVNGSRTLIVLCSPAAKKSHWVSEEIRLFRKLHGDGSVLCALVDGTPETSFPSILLENGREPLAANLIGGRDVFHTGVMQLTASMLGLGLDQLIQRDAKRRKRRLQAITVSAVTLSAVMGIATYSAVEASNEADANRAQAEDLVEYMITDLKTKLEPLGRLDLLDGVGDKVITYYDSQNTKDMSDESLARQARARHVLGQVAIDAGRMYDAEQEITAAANLTRKVLLRNPNDLKVIYAHAQSEYWMGKIQYKKRNYEAAMPFWSEYKILAQKLYQADPGNYDLIMERAWGDNNIGLLHNRLGNYRKAEQHYNEALHYMDIALSVSPNSQKTEMARANALAGAAQVASNYSTASQTLAYRNQQIKIYEKQLETDPNNYEIKFRLVQARTYIYSYLLIPKNSKTTQALQQLITTDLANLVDHDPDNIRWRSVYRKHRYNLLLEDIRDEKHANHLHKFINDFSENKPDFKTLLQLQDIEIRREHALGNSHVAQTLLYDMNKQYNSKANINANHYSAYIALMRLNTDVGDNNKSAIFAGKILALTSIKKRYQRPMDIQFKAMALAIIGKCEASRVHSENLSSRGFSVEIPFPYCI